MSQKTYVKCHHVYEPQRDDELKLTVGDIVEVTSKEYETWWVGKNLNTQLSGWFPTNFVTPTDKPEIEATSVEPCVPPQQMLSPPPDSSESPNVHLEKESHEEKAKPEVAKGHSLAEVQHDYEAQASDELSLEKGAIVTILEEVDGWYKGDLNGHIGVFPANFVKKIEHHPTAEATEIDSEAEETQSKPKGFKLAAYGVKQGGIGSLFSGGIPSLKKSNRHSQEIPEHQAPIQETINEMPEAPPKKNIPLPPPPQPEQEEVVTNKPSTSLPPTPQEPEKPEITRASTDSSVGRQSIEEPISPTTKRKSGFGGFRPPIPKIPIPKFPSLPKKTMPSVPTEAKPLSSPPNQSGSEWTVEATQPTSPKVPHVKAPLPPIPSGLPPPLPNVNAPSPPQIPHVKAPLPPVPQEQAHPRSSLPPVPQDEPHVRSPLPPIPQVQPHIRSPLPPVPQDVPHFETPSTNEEEQAVPSSNEPGHLGDLHLAHTPQIPSNHPPESEQESVLSGENAEVEEDALKSNEVREEKNNKASNVTEHSGPKLALVEDDFDAQSSSHLTLRKGGVVTILEQGEDWWRGEMNGKIGLFPPHLVKIIEQSSEESESQEAGGNAPRGGFKLAAYGVKQGGIGGLFAGGLPKLRKTGRRMGSEEPSSTSNEPEHPHPSSPPVSNVTPESNTQIPVIPSRSSTHESLSQPPNLSHPNEASPQAPSVPTRMNIQDSVPQVSSAPARTSIYEPELQTSISPIADAHEIAPQVPSVPTRTSKRQSLPPVPRIPSHTSSYEPEPESEPQMQNFSRSSTYESLPEAPSVPSHTSSYESETQIQSLPHSTYEVQPQSPGVPSRASTYETLPSAPSIPPRSSTQDSVSQVPRVPSRTVSNSQSSVTSTSERSSTFDSLSQIPPSSIHSESEENQPQSQEDSFKSQSAPVIPSHSDSTEISPRIPSRASRPTSSVSPSREYADHSIPSRSSIYSVDSEHSALENTIPTSRNISEFDMGSESPAPSSRTSFYHVDTPRSPTPGKTASLEQEPHSPTTPLPSGNGSQNELPMPTGLPHRESDQERMPPAPPRRASSFGTEQPNRSDREPSQGNDIHGSDSPPDVPRRDSTHDVVLPSTLPSRAETNEPRHEDSPPNELAEEEEVESKISLKSENEEFYEASEDLEIPHEPEPTPNVTTPRYLEEETSISHNLDQVDRALETKSMEDHPKRNIDQVEPTFVPEDHSKRQDLGSPNEMLPSEMLNEKTAKNSVRFQETVAEGTDDQEVHPHPNLNESKKEEDQQVPEDEETPVSLPALPESQPLASLTKGRPMRTKRKPTPVPREAIRSQTELLEKAINEDTQTTKETEPPMEKPLSSEPVVSPEIPKDSSNHTPDEDDQPRLMKPSAFRGQATPFAKLSFGKSGVPALPNKTGHVGELGRRIGGGGNEGVSTSDATPRKFAGVAGATQALAMGELEAKMRAWMKEEMEKLREALNEETKARLRLEEELRQLRELRQ